MYKSWTWCTSWRFYAHVQGYQHALASPEQTKQTFCDVQLRHNQACFKVSWLSNPRKFCGATNGESAVASHWVQTCWVSFKLLVQDSLMTWLKLLLGLDSHVAKWTATNGVLKCCRIEFDVSRIFKAHPLPSQRLWSWLIVLVYTGFAPQHDNKVM